MDESPPRTPEMVAAHQHWVWMNDTERWEIRGTGVSAVDPLDVDWGDIWDSLPEPGGVDADAWVNPVTGHSGDCGCTSCYLSQNQ